MTIHLSEYREIGSWGAMDIPDAKQPPFAVPGQSLPTTHQFVRFVPRVDCQIEFGADPVADASSEVFFANVEYVKALPPGTKLAAIAL